jgi:transposase
MSDIRLSDEEWGKIRECLRQESRVYLGRDEQTCRRFVEAVKWMSRSGAQWRLLPSEYGAWNSVYKRFARWCEAGVWERLLAALATDPDTEHGMIDATIVRAHPCAAGAQKNHGEQALGRSRGGFSCKIHLTADGLGNPLRVILTAGQRHDSTQAQVLLDGWTFEKVLADRGYANEAFIVSLQARGSEAVIPPHQRAKVKREYDTWVYRERHLIECCFNKLKHFRRIFSRFDKLDRSFLGFIQLVCTLLWLR